MASIAGISGFLKAAIETMIPMVPEETLYSAISLVYNEIGSWIQEAGYDVQQTNSNGRGNVSHEGFVSAVLEHEIATKNKESYTTVQPDTFLSTSDEYERYQLARGGAGYVAWNDQSGEIDTGRDTDPELDGGV